MNIKRVLLSAAAMALALTALRGTAVPAATAAEPFRITSTADLPDGDPGDGTCNNKGLFNTGCSLRAAIMEVNASGTRDIVVPAGTYLLTRNGAGENGSETGDLDLRRTMRILASGGRAVIRGESGWDERVFDVQPARWSW